MAEETQYTANTGMATLSASQSSLSGTGSTLILTAGSSGTLIKSVYLKAYDSTPAPRGIIRLFVKAGSTYYLLKEIYMPPVTQLSTSTPVMAAFETKIDLDFSLNSGDYLYASYQSGSSPHINVIAEGLNWTYYSGAIRADTTQFTAKTRVVSVATLNTNLDGTGAGASIYTAGSSPTYNGSKIRSASIKSTVTNTPGMVRIYLQDNSSNIKLLTEIPIPSNIPDATDRAFEASIPFLNDFDLQAGYQILASTQQGENFNIIIEGEDWNYLS